MTSPRVSHPQWLSPSGPAMAPWARTPLLDVAAPEKRVTPTGPLAPSAPQWMCDATTFSMLATISLYESESPRSLKIASPAAVLSLAGTSLRPLSDAVRFPLPFPARTGIPPTAKRATTATSTTNLLLIRDPPPCLVDLTLCTQRSRIRFGAIQEPHLIQIVGQPTLWVAVAAPRGCHRWRC